MSQNPINLLKNQLDAIVSRAIACTPESQLSLIADVLIEKTKSIQAVSGEAE